MEIDTSARRALWAARKPVVILLVLSFIWAQEFGVARHSFQWVIAMLGLTFVGLGLATFSLDVFRRVWRATRPRPHVVIDENGIWDRRGSVGLLKWTDIRFVGRYVHFWLGDGLAINDPPVESLGHLRRTWNLVDYQRDWEGQNIGFELIVDFEGLSMPIEQAWPRIVEVATSQGLKLDEDRRAGPSLFRPLGVR